ncbi:hypothetical protein [Yinghuangia soli]|uniref:Uncharacterized protein n=1 Tax=Yinghuangia soli TaxID=2908204 RepID=A0AA41PX09_9ACTN|nr:hypothetical protein [Yinghuangia soli]MCF2526910.1 hypothetical protein [Yinghuangia soli]
MSSTAPTTPAADVQAAPAETPQPAQAAQPQAAPVEVPQAGSCCGGSSCS